MFSSKAISGRFLPAKTLCLTFDDGPGETLGTGPGPKTSLIADFLYTHQIRGTFFVTGKNAAAYPHLVKKLVACNHIVGNHTYNHPHLPNLYRAGKDVCSEINDTDLEISKNTGNKTIYFRPPYSEWLPELATELNNMPNNGFAHFGPYGCEIDGSDWHYWGKALSEQKCAENYLSLIEQVGKGIVLMHDSTADDEVMLRNNRTYETLQILIPALKARGYRFIGVDEIEKMSNMGAMRADYIYQKVRRVYGFVRRATGR